jgi:DNA polymerase-3 subunit alpha
MHKFLARVILWFIPLRGPFRQSRSKTYNAGMFVHLRLHTEFSVVDSTNRIDDVVGVAAEDGQPALAIQISTTCLVPLSFISRGEPKASNR